MDTIVFAFYFSGEYYIIIIFIGLDYCCAWLLTFIFSFYYCLRFLKLHFAYAFLQDPNDNNK